MANTSRRKLAEFLREVSEWRWDQFVKAEKNEDFTTNQSIVFSLIRGCAMENLNAIRSALGRLDGKVATPVQVLTPKVFYLFPEAEEVQQGDGPLALPEGDAPKKEVVIETGSLEESPTKGFRETTEKMSELPREFPKAVIEAQEQVEKFMRSEGRMPEKVPMVKTVVAAKILHMAQKGNLDAINEVFDQLDGKLVETIKILGDDIYIKQFGRVAPAGAIRNKDGIYQIEAPAVQNMWAQKLDGTKGGPIFID